MGDYLGSLKRPFTDFKRLLLGMIFVSVLPIFSSLVIFSGFHISSMFFSVIFTLIFTALVIGMSSLTLGYILECSYLATKKDFSLPDWKNYRKYIFRGFFSSLIVVFYSIILFLILFLFFKGNVSNLYMFFIQGFIEARLYAILFLIWSLFLFLGIYLLPFSMIDYYATGEMSNVFNFKRVFKNVFKKSYFIRWFVASVGFLIVVDFVGRFLNKEGVSFSIISGIIYFVAYIIYYSLIGGSYDP